MTTYEKVATIISNQMEIDIATLTPQTRFKEDLHADSISIVELVMSFEEEFGESISDEDAEKILTLQDVIDYIDTKQGN